MEYGIMNEPVILGLKGKTILLSMNQERDVSTEDDVASCGSSSPDSVLEQSLRGFSVADEYFQNSIPTEAKVRNVSDVLLELEEARSNLDRLTIENDQVAVRLELVERERDEAIEAMRKIQPGDCIWSKMPITNIVPRAASNDFIKKTIVSCTLKDPKECTVRSVKLDHASEASQCGVEAQSKKPTGHGSVLWSRACSDESKAEVMLSDSGNNTEDCSSEESSVISMSNSEIELMRQESALLGELVGQLNEARICLKNQAKELARLREKEPTESATDSNRMNPDGVKTMNPGTQADTSDWLTRLNWCTGGVQNEQSVFETDLAAQSFHEEARIDALADRHSHQLTLAQRDLDHATSKNEAMLLGRDERIRDLESLIRQQEEKLEVEAKAMDQQQKELEKEYDEKITEMDRTMQGLKLITLEQQRVIDKTTSSAAEKEDAVKALKLFATAAVARAKELEKANDDQKRKLVEAAKTIADQNIQKTTLEKVAKERQAEIKELEEMRADYEQNRQEQLRKQEYEHENFSASIAEQNLKIQKHEAALLEKDRRIQETLELLDTERSKVRQLQASLAHHDTEFCQLEKDRNEQARTAEQAKVLLSKSYITVKELQEVIDRKASQASELESLSKERGLRIEELEKVVKQRTRQIQQCEALLATRDSILETLREENEENLLDAKKTIEKLEKRLKAANSSLRSQDSRLRDLEALNEQTKQELKSTSEKLTERDTKVLELKTKTSQCMRRNVDLEELCRDLRQTVSDEKKHAEEQEKNNRQLNKLVAEKNSKIAQLESDGCANLEDLRKAKQLLSRSYLKIQELQDTVTEKAEKISDLEKIQTDRELQMKDYLGSIAEYEAQKKEHEKALTSKEAEMQLLRDSATVERKRNEETLEVLAQRDVKIRELEAVAAESEKETEKLQVLLKERDWRLAETTAAIEAYQLQQRQHQSLIAEKEAHIECLEKAGDVTARDLEQSKKLLMERDGTIQHLEATVQGISTKISQLEAQKMEQDTKVGNMAETISRLESQKHCFITLVAEKDSMIQQLKKESDSQRHEIQEATLLLAKNDKKMKDLEATVAKTSQQIAELTSRQEMRDQQVEELLNTIRKKEKQSQGLESLIREKESKIVQLTKTAQGHEQGLEEARKVIAEREAEIETLQANGGPWEEHVAAMEHERESLINAFDDLKLGENVDLPSGPDTSQQADSEVDEPSEVGMSRELKILSTSVERHLDEAIYALELDKSESPNQDSFEMSEAFDFSEAPELSERGHNFGDTSVEQTESSDALERQVTSVGPKVRLHDGLREADTSEGRITELEDEMDQMMNEALNAITNHTFDTIPEVDETGNELGILVHDIEQWEVDEITQSLAYN